MRKIFTILTILLLSTPFSLLAQNRTISGVVKDSETGLSIPGATVMVKENNGIGASTDLEGKFTLSVPPLAANLIIRSVGYTEMEVSIGTSTSLTINLSPEDFDLDAVVISASRRQEKILDAPDRKSVV